MQNADDVVDAVVIHWQARIAGIRENIQHLAHIHLVVNGDNAHARLQNILDEQLFKIDRRTDEVALARLHLTAAFCFVKHIQKLVLDVFLFVVLATGALHDHMTAAKNKRQRTQQRHQQLQRHRHATEHTVLVALRDHARQDLTDDEDRQKEHDHADDDPLAGIVDEKEPRSQHHRRQIDDGVADVDRRQHAVGVVEHPQRHRCGAIVLVLRPMAQGHGTGEQKRHFSQGKERRAQDQRQDHQAICGIDHANSPSVSTVSCGVPGSAGRSRAPDGRRSKDPAG